MGPVAVLRDGQWIEPPELTTAGADHNDFHRGWVDLDPLGRWMVTRRDGHGIELWQLGGDGIERVNRLSFEARTDEPISSRFDADSLSLLWNWGTGSMTGVAVRWSLTARSLRRHACLQIAEVTEVRESQDVPRDLCERTRGEGDRPEGVPTTIAPSVDPAKAAAPGGLDATTIPLAEGSYPSAVVLASDGATCVAASSLNAPVRIDASGAMASYPIGDTNTSVRSLVPAPDRGVWFAGSQTFGHVGRDGSVGLLPGFDDPSAATLVGDRAYAFVAAGPSFLRTRESGVEVIPLASELSGLRVAEMAPAEDGSVWLGLTNSLDRTHGPGLVRDALDDGEVLERIDLNEVANLLSLARVPDGGVWFAAVDDDRSGVLGHRLPSGEVKLEEARRTLNPSRCSPRRMPCGSSARPTLVGSRGPVTKWRCGRFPVPSS